MARTGDWVRIRIGNLTNHPIHLHGPHFEVTGTDGGWVPKAARCPEQAMKAINVNFFHFLKIILK